MEGKGGILGIDAGGTFTDLAFLSNGDLSVGASLKVPTRHDDLLSTIGEGVAGILESVDAGEIAGVHLASTLATNATVENKMASAGLILIGYKERDVEAAIERGLFGDVRVKVLPGGHDIRGNEREPLDEALVLEACGELLANRVDGIALSGYFSVRNPSHEIRARDLLRARYPGLSITCGHELVSELDAFKRATTASINAGLIPIVMRLLQAVKRVLKNLGVDAPLSIVRGDGSLVSDEWAERHPVETIVSGPAASAMGARFLGAARGKGRRSWVVDIGGTTTDIVGLDPFGNPIPKNEGAVIGGHQILVRTIDIRTFGLGGDSRISRMKDGTLKVGPRRVVPLAVAAQRDPRVLSLLLEVEAAGHATREPLIFFSGKGASPEGAHEERIAAKLRVGPATLEQLMDGESLGVGQAIVRNIDKYEERGLLTIASFTPTDSLLVLKRLDKWPDEASVVGARTLAAHPARPCAVEELCLEACERVSALAAGEVFFKALSGSRRISPATCESELTALALRSAQPEDEPNVRLRLNADLIGVGAPSWAFLGRTARMLGEEAVLPENAAVAGAVGAAVGTFFMQHTVLVTPLKSGKFRVHMPDGVRDYETLDGAVEESVAFMIPWLEGLAGEAGAHDAPIDWERHDETARISGGTQEVLLWSRILFSVREGGERA